MVRSRLMVMVVDGDVDIVTVESFRWDGEGLRASRGEGEGVRMMV